MIGRGSRISRTRDAAIWILMLMVCPALAMAHEIRPTIAELEIQSGSVTEPLHYKIDLSLNLEALIAEISPSHDDTDEAANADDYNRLRALSSAPLQAAFEGFLAKFFAGFELKADDNRVNPELIAVAIPPVGDIELARTSTVTIGGKLPAATRALTWAWSANFGDSVIRLRGGNSDASDEIAFAQYLQNGDVSDVIPVTITETRSAWRVFTEYLKIGFAHILPRGLDHILFVVGLFLLSPKWRSLLWQVSLFTLAHTITLGLSMAGIIDVSPRIVEPLIAASIVYVAVENTITETLYPWRAVIVFGFGLLHGLGFAGVLADIGLQPAFFAIGLAGFNIGVEIGQLTVIAMCYLSLSLWFGHKNWYRRRVTRPLSAVIAVIGAWWFLERVV